jgi:hypothetical protein
LAPRGLVNAVIPRSRMYDETAIREYLIDSCHSSEAAEKFFRARLLDADLLSLLVHIARDADDHGGDAPMQAAYWASQFPPELLICHESALLERLPVVDGYAGHVALALGKTGSHRGRAAIVEQLADGKRFDAWLFRDALAAADRAG